MWELTACLLLYTVQWHIQSESHWSTYFLTSNFHIGPWTAPAPSHPLHAACILPFWCDHSGADTLVAVETHFCLAYPHSRVPCPYTCILSSSCTPVFTVQLSTLIVIGQLRGRTPVGEPCLHREIERAPWESDTGNRFTLLTSVCWCKAWCPAVSLSLNFSSSVWIILACTWGVWAFLLCLRSPVKSSSCLFTAVTELSIPEFLFASFSDFCFFIAILWLMSPYSHPFLSFFRYYFSST